MKSLSTMHASVESALALTAAYALERAFVAGIWTACERLQRGTEPNQEGDPTQ